MRDIARNVYHTDVTPAGADTFIDYVLDNAPPDSEVYRTVRQIYERKSRLTENVLIINSHYDMVYDTRSRLAGPKIIPLYKILIFGGLARDGLARAFGWSESFTGKLPRLNQISKPKGWSTKFLIHIL